MGMGIGASMAGSPRALKCQIEEAQSPFTTRIPPNATIAHPRSVVNDCLWQDIQSYSAQIPLHQVASYNSQSKPQKISEMNDKVGWVGGCRDAAVRQFCPGEDAVGVLCLRRNVGFRRRRSDWLF